MEFGVKYTTSAPIDQLANIVESQAKESNLNLTDTQKRPGHISLRFTQSAPWHIILLRRLPQRVYFILEDSDGDVRVTYDTKYFFWYSAFIIASCFVTAVLFKVGANIFEFDLATGIFGYAVIRAVFLMISLIMFFVNFAFVTAGNGRHIEGLWQSIRTEVTIGGYHLEPETIELNKRYVCKSLLYLGFVFTLAISFLARQPKGTILLSNAPALVRFLLLSLVICVAALGLAAVCVLRTKGFSLRLLTVIPGLLSLLSMLLLLSAQFPSIALTFRGDIGPYYVVYWNALREVDAAPASVNEETRPTTQQSHRTELLAKGVKYLRLWALIHIVGSVFLIALAVSYAFQAVESSSRVWPEFVRMSLQRDTKLVRAAIAGDRFLGVFRFILTTIWLLITAAILALLLVSCLSLWEAISTNWTSVNPTIATGRVAASSVVSTMAFGHQSVHWATAVTVHVCWIVYSLASITVFVLSLSTLVRQRRKKLTDLVKNTALDHKNAGPARSMLARLSEKAGISCPTLSITESMVPFVLSDSFGIVNRVNFVEISSRCLAICGESEIEAVLAHEVIHFSRRHLLRRNLLRLLGRLTLVGDTFAGGLEDTFGYETDADIAAVEELGVREESLISALRRIRHVSGAANGVQLVNASGSTPFLSLEAYRQTISRKMGVPTPVLKRIMTAVRLFIYQYTNSARTSYWHPAHHERVTTLLKRKCGEDNLVSSTDMTKRLQ